MVISGIRVILQMALNIPLLVGLISKGSGKLIVGSLVPTSLIELIGSMIETLTADTRNPVLVKEDTQKSKNPNIQG